LTGVDEARASFGGARWALEQAGRDYQEPLTVVDIGGGSTEIATRETVSSLPIGAVRLTERFVNHDPPKTEELGACRTSVRLELDGIPIDRSGTLTFVGGTADTAARMLHAYNPNEFVRVAELKLADLEDLLALVSSLPVEQRKRLHALPESRVDIFPTGLVIIDEIVRCANAQSFLVSESDLLIGYVRARLGV
jgi:exopolyphosphatase/guanosine-5'-triphosphate,3'-diphosphate pyrophosphatase